MGGRLARIVPARVKHAARVALAEAAFRSGWVGHRLRQRRGQAAVLMYHRVLPEDSPLIRLSQAGMVVTARTFRMQMEFLTRRFAPVALDRFIDGLRGGFPGKRPACLVTFDDGWIDTLEVALPILREFGIPGVVFLATDFVERSDTFWTDRGTRAFARLHDRIARGADGETFPPLDGLDDVLDPVRVAGMSRDAFLDAVMARMKEMEPAAREATLRVAREAAGEDPTEGARQIVAWDDVARLAEGGVAPGAHSCGHHILTELSRDEQRREIVESRRVIRERTGRAPRAFCYPNGNHDDAIVAMVREAGYDAAFAVQGGMVRPGDDPLVLPRISMHEDVTRSPALFGCWVAGVFR